MAEAAHGFRCSQYSGDRCQGAKLLLVGRDGKEEQEQQIDRSAINRVKIDGLLEANQDSKRLVETRYARMWNRNPSAGAR